MMRTAPVTLLLVDATDRQEAPRLPLRSMNEPLEVDKISPIAAKPVRFRPGLNGQCFLDFDTSSRTRKAFANLS
jgi:hypothetical protein